jgi:hypothetical protein
MVAIRHRLGQLLVTVLDVPSPSPTLSAAQAGWAAVVFTAVWDSTSGWHGATARRSARKVRRRCCGWYIRRAARRPADLARGHPDLLQGGWYRLATGNPYPTSFLSTRRRPDDRRQSVALGGVHARVIAIRHQRRSLPSTLRALEGFIAVAISIGVALFSASQILY